MRRYHQLLTVTLLMMMSGANAAFADLSVAPYVDEFNAMNNGKGLYYIARANAYPDEIYIEAPSNHNVFPNWIWDAYDAKTSGTMNGNFFFKSFCVEQSSPVIWDLPTYGQTDYANNKTTTTSNNSLYLGIALLYKEYATGTLPGYDYVNPRYSSSALQAFINGVLYGSAVSVFQQHNQFADYLMTLNGDIAHWTQIYDPNTRYDEIGDYSVFVLRTGLPASYIDGTGGKGGTELDLQDVLYVMKCPPSVVPEPASLALWGLLGLGIGGYARFRRKTLPLKSV